MPKLYLPETKTFDYDDVILVPRKGIVKSRSEADVSARLGGRVFALPVIPANMSTIVDQATCEFLAARNIFYVMHRFDIDALQFTKDMQGKGFYSSVSLGIKPVDYETVDRFAAEQVTPEYITVDVAHGDSDEVIRIVEYIADKLPKSYIIAGNIASVDAGERLVNAGSNALKVGIGPGCFAAGTRVLMADSTYKNIESVQVGDRVINMDGKPVSVIGTRNSGLRMVQEYKNVNWYANSYATADHKHFGVDLGGLRPESVSDEGYAKIAEKNKKIAGFPSRKQWMELSDDNLGALLFPRNVTFELADSFEIDLNEFSQRDASLDKLNMKIKPSYDLGYIFGTFLGDGSAKIPVKPKENGHVSWSFGAAEQHIADKLSKAVLKVTGREISTINPKHKNIIILQLNSTVWGRFLHPFGKKSEKHLPPELLTNDKKYLQGLYDGLMDSDGHFGKDGRANFTNTSTQLIELVSLLTLQLKGVIPNQAPHNAENPYGGLKNIIDLTNFNEAYRTHLNASPGLRFTKDFYCVKFSKKPQDYAVVETYDIEVDCPTHSFIANNVIVHNSACLTAPNTGFGTFGWQLSAVADIADTFRDSDVQIIADGGIRKYGDIAKSIAFGADMVMIGGMFAGHTESPGSVLEVDGEFKKAFFGSASEHQKGEQKHVEGKKMLVPFKGSLDTTLQIIKENLQSSVSYAGGTKLSDLTNVEYVLLRK